MKFYFLILLSFLFLIPFIQADNDYSIFQGQFYVNNQFQTNSAHDFVFTVYDDEFIGTMCFNASEEISTGNWGEWSTNQSGVNTACGNYTKNYFLEITIDGDIQTPRRRLLFPNYVLKNSSAVFWNVTANNICYSNGTGCAYQSSAGGWTNDSQNTTTDLNVIMNGNLILNTAGILKAKDSGGTEWNILEPHPDDYNFYNAGTNGFGFKDKSGTTTLTLIDNLGYYSIGASSTQQLKMGCTANNEIFINSWRTTRNPPVLLPISFQMEGVTKAQLKADGDFDFVGNILSHQNFYQDNGGYFFQKNTAGEYKYVLGGRDTDDGTYLFYGLAGLHIYNEDGNAEAMSIDNDLNANFYGNLFAPNICYSDGTGCRQNLTNIALTNQSNNFTGQQNINGSLNITNSTGTSIFFVNSTSGNVGIGTTTPTSALHVKNTLTIEDATNTNTATLSLTHPYYGRLNYAVPPATGKSEVRFVSKGATDGAGQTYFVIASTEAADTGNNLLMGVADGRAFLTNALNYSTAGDLHLGGTSWSANGAMVIKSTGNVGIGTTTPGYLFEVKSGTTSLFSVSSDGWVRGSSYIIAPDIRTPGAFRSNNYVGYTGGTTPINIGSLMYLRTDTGNVGIGTTTPTAKLDVNGTINVSGLFKQGIGTPSRSPSGIYVTNQSEFDGKVYFDVPPEFTNGLISSSAGSHNIFYNSIKVRDNKGYAWGDAGNVGNVGVYDYNLIYNATTDTIDLMYNSGASKILSISNNTITAINGNFTGNITANEYFAGTLQGLTTNKLINGSTSQCWLNFSSGILVNSDC